jgi:hypothetical protein
MRLSWTISFPDRTTELRQRGTPPLREFPSAAPRASAGRPRWGVGCWGLGIGKLIREISAAEHIFVRNR